MDDTDHDQRELLNRIDGLEEQVQSLQKTIKRMQPSRRDVLKAGVGAAALGAAGLSGYGVGKGEAAEGDRGIGGPDDYWDGFYGEYFEGDEADFETVHAEELNSGGPDSDGDGTERQIWVIGNGDSDPSDASDGDLIFEEEE